MLVEQPRAPARVAATPRARGARAPAPRGGAGLESTGAAGTPVYMAPEQFRGGMLTPAADIHALGMIAFTLLVGSAYWQDEAARGQDPIAFALAASSGPVEPATARAARRGAALPPGMDAWFARATAADPAARFASAVAAVGALAVALGEPGAALSPDEDRFAPQAPDEGREGETGTRSADGPAGWTRTDGGSEGTQGEGTVSGAPGAAVVAPGAAVVAPGAAVVAPGAAPVAPRRPGGRARWQIGAAAVLGASALAASLLTASPGAPPEAAPLRATTTRSLLDAADAVLACPVLDAAGVDAPPGWLGAAAAATVCERARILLGGSTARTLVPAELLSLPRQPVDRFPLDPYAAPEARARSVEAARRRAAAYVDGEVAREASPGAFAARARIEQLAHRVDDPALAAELVRRFEQEPSSWGRSTLAATASCLLQPLDPGRAAELSLLSVQIEPKNPTGEFCAPWVQLAAVTRGTASAESALRAMQAWAPWDGYAWLLEEPSPGDGGRALAFARRAHALSPLDAYVADVLASRLLAGGARSEARGIALALAAGRYPSQRVESELLLVRVEASEARFGAALARARRAMTPSAEDAGWVRVQRLDIAWRALELGLIVGRAGEIADLAVERFLDPEPPPLDGAHHIDVPLRVAALCARATAAASRRCFARLRALRPRLAGGILPGTDAFTDGAERYARADLAGAARAWRPLLRDPGPFAAVMADAMAAVFERVGEAELVERLEKAVAGGESHLGGASLATARAARRAARRGDAGEARALAKQVIEAWAIADEPVPALDEMRRIAGPR